MYSQDQSTNYSLLQLQKTTLSQWVKELVRAGREKDLSNLLEVVPIIQKLSDTGIGFSMNGIDISEPVVLKQFAQEIKQSLNQIEQKNDSSEDSSSHGQRFFQTFYKNIYSQMSKVYMALEDKLPLDQLNALQTALKAYLDKSQVIFQDYLKSTNPSTTMQQVWDIYSTCLDQIFTTYIRVEIRALKNISRKVDNAEKHGYALRKIKKNQKKQEKKERKEKKEDYEDQEDEEEAQKKEAISEQEKPEKLKTEENGGRRQRGKKIYKIKPKLPSSFLKKSKANLNGEQ